MIPNAHLHTLLPMRFDPVPQKSIVKTDSATISAVVAVSEFHHRHVSHRKVFMTKRRHHSNDHENFLNPVEQELHRVNGLAPDNFYRLLQGMSADSTAPQRGIWEAPSEGLPDDLPRQALHGQLMHDQK